MAIVSPLASSMFTPGIDQIAKDFNTDKQMVVATTTGFVIMLGLGPLVLAPFSETFGRRAVYMWCFSIFTLLQVPTALAPNIETLIAVRTISGFFGSVGIANGGGTISDMYPSSERAGIFGWYLLGPLLGPTLGPLFGGVVVTRLNWRWLYWIMTIVCACNTTVGYFFLQETYVPVLLARKKGKMLEEREQSNGEANKKPITFEGEDTRPLWQKLLQSLKRPIAIFIQPIVLTMSIYQALIFGTSKCRAFVGHLCLPLIHCLYLRFTVSSTCDSTDLSQPTRYTPTCSQSILKSHINSTRNKSASSILRQGLAS